MLVLIKVEREAAAGLVDLFGEGVRVAAVAVNLGCAACCWRFTTHFRRVLQSRRAGLQAAATAPPARRTWHQYSAPAQSSGSRRRMCRSYSSTTAASAAVRQAAVPASIWARGTQKLGAWEMPTASRRRAARDSGERPGEWRKMRKAPVSPAVAAASAAGAAVMSGAGTVAAAIVRKSSGSAGCGGGFDECRVADAGEMAVAGSIL